MKCLLTARSGEGARVLNSPAYKWLTRQLTATDGLSSPPPFIMSLPSFGFCNDYCTTILSASALLVLAIHLVPYVVDAHKIRSIPGPWFAKFTDAWLGRAAARGHRSEVVHQLHKQYGKYPLPLIPTTTLGTDSSASQEPLFASLQTTSQSPTQTPSKSSTPTETEA